MRLLLLTLVGLVCVQGHPMQRMFHGTQSDAVPYHVHIWLYDPFNYTWPGSGVLITKSHVLTAAVNIHHYERWDLGFGSQQQKGLKTITSRKAFIHENFNEETDDNNLGIIVLPFPIRFSVSIAPISLPQQNERVPVEGQVGTITAFSYMSDYGPISTALEFGRQTILSDNSCETVYPHLHGIVNHFFCASDKDFNVCGGAQGAGLVVTHNKRTVLAGIVSFGDIWKNCSTHTPPGFIKVSQYVDWILSKVE